MKSDNKFIPYGRQWIDETDIANVLQVMKSDFLTGGSNIEKFEELIKSVTGAKYAVVVNSGTSALHLSMIVSGIKEGDFVATSPNTFLASANCAIYVGATPYFSDIELGTYNIDPISLENKWNKKTRAVVAVHYAGQSCDISSISEIAKRNDAIVVEDACHAFGGKFEKDGTIYTIGNHNWADITVFSFHPVKTFTTGEGGVLVTNKKEYADKARLLRNHGIIRNRELFEGLGDDKEEVFNERGPWYYEMVDVGYNFRITDLQCAIGISQLKKVDKFIERRREIVDIYNNYFESVNFIKTPQIRNKLDKNLISWHLYTILIDYDKLKINRTVLMNKLIEKGIGSQVLYIPIHLQPYYRKHFGYKINMLPITEEYYSKALSLPLYPALTDKEVGYVATNLIEIIKANKK